MPSSLFGNSKPEEPRQQTQPFNTNQFDQARVQEAIAFAKQFRSPKEAFFALAKQKGIDPVQFISMLKK